MSFETGWPLLLLLPLAVWTASEWSRSPRRLGLLLKALALAAICLALTRPQWRIRETYTAVAVLSDASDSIPDGQRERQRAFVERLRAEAGAHSVREMEFGAYPLRALGDPHARRSTNLESAILNALGALPADRLPRVLVLSDGRANAGAVERAAYQAWSREVAVDTVALPGRPEPDLRLAGVRLPLRAFAGERFPIELDVESPAGLDAALELRAEGRPIGEESVVLPTGRSAVTVRARIETPGATLVEGRLSAAGTGELHFARAVSILQPRALLLSPDPVDQDRPLIEVVRSAGFQLERAEGVEALDGAAELDYDLVVCSNADYEAWPEGVKQRLAAFVAAGGGFLLIAGERSQHREREAGGADPLRGMLPATLAPPRTPEGTAVVLVVDKSSSMEGKKMQLARQSALGVVENIRRIDSVGVLAFDNSFEWAAPLRRNEVPAETSRLISGIVADGGTQIAPALAEAYRVIEPLDAVYKHILLLTDGISEEGDSIELAREAAANEVTISTIGLGQDVNRSYLERVARSADGKSYFLLDISALEQIVLEDVQEHTGTSVQEKPFYPVALREFEIIDGLDLAAPGPLLGWVRFEAKPAAEVLLTTGEEDPLFVRWQFGLGRAAVFASDAKDRWATNWVPWDGYDRFWSNALRDLLPRTAATDTAADYDAAADEIVVRYRAARAGDAEEPPELYAIGPDGYRGVALPKASGEGFEARFPAQGLHGLFRIRPAERSRNFPETAYYRENTELSRYGADAELLRTISRATGGRHNPEPGQVFAGDGRSLFRRMDLWPLLLALAILLNLVELLARKGWLPVLGRWA